MSNVKKHLIRVDNKIHTLSEDMSVLTYPELTEALTFEEYDKWGMNDLSGYEKPVEWVKRPMGEGDKVGEGRAVRETIDKNEFVINSLDVPVTINTQVFTLVKSQNKIQILNEFGEWADTGLAEPLTQIDFETHGMDDLSAIPKAKWQELDDNFEVITWTDGKPVDGIYENKWLYVNTDPFSPLDLMNSKDEFEILTYSDETEEVPSTTIASESTIGSGKLFTATLDNFDIVTGVEVK